MNKVNNAYSNMVAAYEGSCSCHIIKQYGGYAVCSQL
jgi:hypothetical protein